MSVPHPEGSTPGPENHDLDVSMHEIEARFRVLQWLYKKYATLKLTDAAAEQVLHESGVSGENVDHKPFAKKYADEEIVPGGTYDEIIFKPRSSSHTGIFIDRIAVRYPTQDDQVKLGGLFVQLYDRQMSDLKYVVTEDETIPYTNAKFVKPTPIKTYLLDKEVGANGFGYSVDEDNLFQVPLPIDTFEQYINDSEVIK